MKVLFVGYGNMACAIAKRIDSNTNGKYTIQVCGRDRQKAQDFIQTNNLHNASSIDSAPIDIQDKIVILAIKPYGLDEFIYKGVAKSVYSVLAGVNIESLKQHIKAKSYIKLMPNVGAAFGLSSSVAFTQNADLQEVKEICESFGSVVFVDNEKLVDSSIATSGSSPAFLALIAQALIDSGVREGLKRSDSAILVQKTFEGVAKLLESKTPQQIIDLVTTPGGTTIEGLSVLESSAVRGAIMQACHASVQKIK